MGPVVLNISIVIKMNRSLECKRELAGRAAEVFVLLVLKGLHDDRKDWT